MVLPFFKVLSILTRMTGYKKEHGNPECVLAPELCTTVCGVSPAAPRYVSVRRLFSASVRGPVDAQDAEPLGTTAVRATTGRASPLLPGAHQSRDGGAGPGAVCALARGSHALQHRVFSARCPRVGAGAANSERWPGAAAHRSDLPRSRATDGIPRRPEKPHAHHRRHQHPVRMVPRRCTYHGAGAAPRHPVAGRVGDHAGRVVREGVSVRVSTAGRRHFPPALVYQHRR